VKHAVRPVEQSSLMTQLNDWCSRRGEKAWKKKLQRWETQRRDLAQDEYLKTQRTIGPDQNSCGPGRTGRYKDDEVVRLDQWIDDTQMSLIR